MAPILIAAGSVAVWSGHFEGVFQEDDQHTIVKNRAIQELANVPHFFKSPQTYADQPEYAQYRPLALVSLAVDYQLAGSANARIFAVDSFAWFLLEAVAFFCVCRLVLGRNWFLSFFAVALFLFHPVTGETLNFASHRGDIIGAVGLLVALAIAIVWPGRMPATIMSWQGVPKTDWDNRRRKWTPIVNAQYAKLLRLPPTVDLVIVLVAMLADPDVAVYPLLLLAYILLLDNGPGRKATWRRVLPAAILCVAFEAGQLALTWRYGVGFRMPALPYWTTQPWAALTYLANFFVPVHLTPESGLEVFPQLWSPPALAGYAGLAALVFAALWLGKREAWRKVAFGIWWFLIALLPSAAIPQRMAASDTRLYLPMLGLAIATAAAGGNLYRGLANSWGRQRATLTASVVALAVVGLLCTLTFERNEVWQSALDFRRDVAEKNPTSGGAQVLLGIAELTEGQSVTGYQLVQRGEKLIQAARAERKDAPDQVRLARAFDLWNKDAEAEAHFKLAIESDPTYSPAWSAYSQWLEVRQRAAEAYKAALKAIALRPWNTEAQRTLLQFYSENSDWQNLKKTADTMLQADSADPDARRALSVVQAMGEAVAIAENKAKSEPTVDDFLALSVQYYRARRFEDSVQACKQALKLRPDLSEAYSNMAAASYALGRLDDSISELREALRIRPDFGAARSNLNFLLRQKGEQPPVPVSR